MGDPSEADLLAAFEAIKAAMFEHDRSSLELLIATDFRGTSIYGHPEERETILTVYGDGQVDLELFDVDELQTVVAGAFGVIRGRGHIRGTFGEDAFEHRLRFCDVYIHRDGRWQYYISSATEIREM